MDLICSSISSHSLSGTGCQQQFSRRARGSCAGSETHGSGLTGPNTPETDPGPSPTAPAGELHTDSGWSHTLNRLFLQKLPSVSA